MQWSNNPLYAQDLQIFVNWCQETKEHRPDTWKVGDGTYHDHERWYKDQLCTEFAKVFGGLPPYSGERLRANALALISLKEINIGNFTLLSRFEISRLNEWIKHADAEELWQTFAFLYSSANDKKRYRYFVNTVEGFLESRGSEGRVSLPMLTFWLAYYAPQSELYIKPRTTNDFYKEYGKKPPSGDTVQRYLRLKDDALNILADLHAAGLSTADMIDVQSFIWVVGTRYAWG